MNIIVAGSRYIQDYRWVCYFLDRFVTPSERPTIVTGGCRGVDALASLWALTHKLDQIEVPADWDKHGKAAGPIRNAEMAKVGNKLIAIYDKVPGRGTRSMISIARKKGLPVAICDYKPAVCSK